MQQKILSSFIQGIVNNRGSIMRKIALVIAVSIIGYRLIQIITKKIKRKIEENSLQTDTYTQKTGGIISKFVSILLIVFLILAVFQIIGFDTAIIMGGISLSLGFAMESIIGNMVSGIMLLTNKKVQLGDFVQFMGNLNLRGTIEEINIRYTVIRTFDKKRNIIPNSIIVKTPIQTLKSEPLLRGEVFFTVPRHVNTEQIKKIILETINTNPNTLYHEYSNTRIENFDNRGLQMKGIFFADPKQKTPFIVARALRIEIAKKLKEYGINIPYPHINLTAEN